MNDYKPILCIDFDGVIHSYTSGWKGPRNIPDPPVPGALNFLLDVVTHFDVQIYSTRSRYWFGRWAMKSWLKYHFVANYPPEWEHVKEPFRSWIAETAFADPWDVEVEHATNRFIKLITFPKHKPPAFLQIDDRAITFTGIFPTVEEIQNFKPWNKA